MSDYSEYKTKNVSEVFCFVIKREIENIEHRNGKYIVKFVQQFGAQGVIFPDNLGFKPELNMKVIWDSDGSLGAVGDLSFYNVQGALLCALHRDKVSLGKDWLQSWHNVTQKSVSDNIR